MATKPDVIELCYVCKGYRYTVPQRILCSACNGVGYKIIYLSV